MRGVVKSFLKEILWSVPRYDRPHAGRPICLYAARRGGSTLLMQVIGANRGIRYYDEPFSVFSAPYRGLYRNPPLPLRYASQFTSIHVDEAEEVKAYLAAILDGNLTWNNPWKFWDPEYDFVYTRKLLKILDAKPLIDWIDKTFSVDTVYLARHPVPVALSVLQRKWDSTSRAYLQDEDFCRRYLTDSLLDFSWRIYMSGDRFANAILNWCLDNAAPFALIPIRPQWVSVTYEDLVVSPEAVIRTLSEKLDLKGRERMLRQIRRPSSSSRSLEIGPRTPAGREALVSGWVSKVTPDMVRTADEILERFSITLYRAGNPMPTGQWSQSVPARAIGETGAREMTAPINRSVDGVK